MVNVIVVSGFGLNCEEETAFAFTSASSIAKVDIIHINDLGKNSLEKYQIMAIPGGFSYGDHTGAGNAFSWYIKNNLMDEFYKFRQQDKLIIGICNGCQILLYTFPEELEAGLTQNKSGKYQCQWVDVIIPKSNSVWCQGITKIKIPIAHGEGRFQMKKDSVNIAMKYFDNPNGSDLSAAAISSSDGKMLAMMPHPERAILFTQRDDWTFIKEKLLRTGEKIPKWGDGITIFRNAVNYFK